MKRLFILFFFIIFSQNAFTQQPAVQSFGIFESQFLSPSSPTSSRSPSSILLNDSRMLYNFLPVYTYIPTLGTFRLQNEVVLLNHLTVNNIYGQSHGPFNPNPNELVIYGRDQSVGDFLNTPYNQSYLTISENGPKLSETLPVYEIYDEPNTPYTRTAPDRYRRVQQFISLSDLTIRALTADTGGQPIVQGVPVTSVNPSPYFQGFYGDWVSFPVQPRTGLGGGGRGGRDNSMLDQALHVYVIGRPVNSTQITLTVTDKIVSLRDLLSNTALEEPVLPSPPQINLDL